jgi:hypothetical protein
MAAMDTMRPAEFVSLSREQWQLIKPLHHCFNVLESTDYQHININWSILMNSLLLKLPQNIDRTEEDLEQLQNKCFVVQKQNTVWYDKEGFKLVQYFPGFISDQLSMDIITALENLISRTNLHNPLIREQKHRHFGFQTWKQSLPPGTPCGVLCLNIHHQIGHPHH